ncbi:hypothetical protein BGZ95_011151 [Linnemannia exigua]|uniref:Uncharacterized protein n=1 Tax=Linnemannia exigua TaxID=604196 RepID=A0AAD4H5H2_9FUNG|nr:hypothetical protein BGZ95_011151 [Linnemannia exigua]
MRYFRNVTSKDREDKQGYYSSARHVMPSNTTGNFGHGPPIGVALDRFAAKQAQQYQQQQQQQQQHPSQQQQQHAESQSVRLPPLYTALPDQRPSGPSKVSPSYGHSESSPSDQSSPTHSPMQHRPSYGGSPAQSPIEKPMAYGRQHQSHPYHHQSQQQGPMLKPKAIQPRSIAPAPISPTSPAMQQPEVSPRAASKRTDRQTFVKIEPKDMPLQYHQQQQQQHPYQGQAHVQHRLSVSGSQAIAKRKWSREHSPVRQGPRLNTETTAASSESVAPVDRVEDASSAELHLLSSRKQSRSVAVSSSVNKDSTKKSAQKMKMQRYQMTTIRCWHGAIAQKSYGIEKRYLCPPPMVQVSAGVNTKQVRSEQPHVTMSVIHEKVDIRGHHGENLMEQDCTLDDALRCSFRNLHVTGTGSDSSKRFKLGLQVYLNKNATMPTAIMDSNPIPIISKPSKKTAKAGNASCFILNGMSVSLLNRINAQTVRTKYMAVDNNAVCAKIGSWSSFTIKMVKPPPAPPVKLVPASMGVFRSPGHSTKFVPIRMKGENPMGPALAPQAVPMVRANSNGRADGSGVSPNGSAPSSSFQFRHQQQLQHEPVYVFSNSEPVLYGSEIVLINDLTGIMTDRLIIRKVENGKVSRSGTGPVSQMQKIVLEHPDRVHPEDGRSYYLSASSIGSPKIEGKIPLQAAMDRSPLLEYRTSSKKASIMDMTDAQDDDEDEMNEDDDYNGQSNSMPRRMGKNQDSVAVDDFVCWTIAGIAKFDYTYFGPIPASVDSDVDPTKVPSIQSCPQYNANTNTMTMQVKNVFEKLTPTEEARLLKHQEDPYERKLTLSEYVYKRCEDVRQPMRDEEGPIQLWLAQHGPIRMRRRQLEEVLPEGASAPTEMAVDGGDESSDDESSDDEEDGEEKKNNKQQAPEDPLPKIASKSSSSAVSASSNGTSSVAAAAALASAQDAAAAAALAYAAKHQTQLNIMNGRHYGGSHLPASMNPAQKQKRRKLVKKLMGLEAELPYGCEVRASHDAQGHARAELDILMVERSSGIAYRTGYKVVYSRERERADWVVEVLG